MVQWRQEMRVWQTAQPNKNCSTNVLEFTIIIIPAKQPIQAIITALILLKCFLLTWMTCSWKHPSVSTIIPKCIQHKALWCSQFISLWSTFRYHGAIFVSNLSTLSEPQGVKYSINHRSNSPIRLFFKSPVLALTQWTHLLKIKFGIVLKGRNKPLIIHPAALPYIATEAWLHQ